MTHRLALAALVAGAALSIGAHAPNPRDEAAVARMLADKAPGEPRQCLSSFDARSSSVHDGVVLFRASSSLVYRNDMNGCATLREDDILQTNLYGTSRLCRGDIAQIIDRTSRTGRGACTFGDFVPYRRAR